MPYCATEGTTHTALVLILLLEGMPYEVLILHAWLQGQGEGILCSGRGLLHSLSVHAAAVGGAPYGFLGYAAAPCGHLCADHRLVRPIVSIPPQITESLDLFALTRSMHPIIISLITAS
jgi:hypothetical protein